MKIGVTAVLGKHIKRKSTTRRRDPVSRPRGGLGAIAPALKQKSDYRVLLAHATMEETKELAKNSPSSTPWFVPTDRKCRRKTRDGQGDQDAADHRRPQGDVRRSCWACSMPEPRSATSACRWIRAIRRIARNENAHGRLSGPVEDDRICRAGATARRRIRWRRITAASSARRNASPATKNPTTFGRRAGTPTPTRRWPSSIRRGTSIPSASVATWSAGIRRFFPVRERLREPEKDAAPDQHGLRGLPRAGRETLPRPNWPATMP